LGVWSFLLGLLIVCSAFLGVWSFLLGLLIGCGFYLDLGVFLFFFLFPCRVFFLYLFLSFFLFLCTGLFFLFFSCFLVHFFYKFLSLFLNFCVHKSKSWMVFLNLQESFNCLLLRLPHGAISTFGCGLLFGLWSFLFSFSCSLAGCFSFIYLFIYLLTKATCSLHVLTLVSKDMSDYFFKFNFLMLHHWLASQEVFSIKWL
jgi:hypothetical protein